MSVPYELVDNIRKAINKSFDLRRFTVEEIYNGRAFRVTGRGNYTNIYIRVEGYDNIIVNLSTIDIDPNFKRQGVLTRLANNIASVKGISYIKIGGVCTQEMLNWCNKNGYKRMGEYGYDYYREV